MTFNPTPFDDEMAGLLVEPPEDPPPAEQMTGMEKLQSLPLVDRIVWLLSTLRDLQQKNMEKSGKLALTKQQELTGSWHRGKAAAYQDTSCFIAKFFEAELRERLQVPAPETNDK